MHLTRRIPKKILIQFLCYLIISKYDYKKINSLPDELIKSIFLLSNNELTSFIEKKDKYFVVEIFKTENLHENLIKLNGEFIDNNYVKEVVDFINKDKKRPICTPFSK